MSAATAWHTRTERGSSLGMRITVWFYRRLGRRVARLLVYPIVAYFFATDPAGRRASLRYLERVRAAPGGHDVIPETPSWRHVFRQYLEFGLVILDRVGLWLGEREDFQIVIHGREHLSRIAEEKRGAILLGSHLGSFDVMRLLATESPIAVNVLMFTRHAARINRIFRELGRGVDLRVIEVRENSVQHMFEARKCIERGEIVAILGDRVPPSDRGRVCRVDFLGERAPFPQGPFLLAELLGCPVVLMTCLRTGEAAYTIHVEPFAERVNLPRTRKAETVREYCQAYARHLGAFCMLAPYQWFNFYDFWDEGQEGAPV